ncbi:MAG: hypothetical protein ABJN35_00805 [Erythrobacter sp.]
MKQGNSTVLGMATSLAAMALVGCAGTSDQYPSLAARDAERETQRTTGQFTPADPDETVAPSSQTFGQLRGFVEQARSAHQEFMASGTDTRRLIQDAQSTDSESDLRARALVAVAELSVLHGRTNIALGDLDQMEFNAASTFAPLDDIRAAQVLVGQMAAEQEAFLNSLDSITRQF